MYDFVWSFFFLAKLKKREKIPECVCHSEIAEIRTTVSVLSQ